MTMRSDGDVLCYYCHKRLFYKTGSHSEPICKRCSLWIGNPVKYRDKPIGRNQICPCGSGLKFKKCCMHNIIRVIKVEENA